MTEQDCKQCQVAAVALRGISILGLLLFCTIPSAFFMFDSHSLHPFEKGLFAFFLLTGLLFGLRSWHLYFDSQLLKNLGNKKLSLSDVDQIVLRLFRKNIQGKTVEVRIKSCYKLVKGFYVLLVLHLLCYIGVIVFLVF
jgi:hypothetical protein